MTGRYHICERLIFCKTHFSVLTARLALERAVVRGENTVRKITQTVGRQAHLQERTKENIHLI